MTDEIRQDGKVVLSSEDGFSIPMFFNNLCGKNFSGEKYRDYIKYIALGEMGFKPGRIEFYRDGVLQRTGEIPNRENHFHPLLPDSVKCCRGNTSEQFAEKRKITTKSFCTSKKLFSNNDWAIVYFTLFVQIAFIDANIKKRKRTKKKIESFSFYSVRFCSIYIDLSVNKIMMCLFESNVLISATNLR